MQNLSEAQVEKLISMVQMKPVLYDKSHEESRSISQKEKIWSDIASEVCASDRVVKTAWRSIRDQFHKSLHYIMAEAEEGMPMKPTRKYKYFDRLLFLVESPDLRQSLSNVTDLRSMKTTKDPLKVKSRMRRTNVDFEEDSFEFNGFEGFKILNKLPMDNCSVDEKPTGSSDFEITAESTNSAADDIDDVEEQPLQIYVKDSHTGFLDMVAEQLNKLPEVTQEETKMMILTLLHKKVTEAIRNKRKPRKFK